MRSSWGDLAEDQDQNCQDHRYDADHISAKAVCKCGCKGRSRNVHNVVSDENRTEKLGRLVLQDIESHGCTLVSLSARERRRILFTDISAVSLDEKKADNASRISNMIIW